MEIGLEEVIAEKGLFSWILCNMSAWRGMFLAHVREFGNQVQKLASVDGWSRQKAHGYRSPADIQGRGEG